MARRGGMRHNFGSDAARVAVGRVLHEELHLASEQDHLMLLC